MSYSDVALALKLQYPREYVSLSRGFTATHRGADLCWSSNYGGCYAVVTAPADGEVVALVDGKDNDTRTSNWGNYVKIKHADGVYTLMAHLLKGTFMVALGANVKRGQSLAKMDNSGNSFGCHVHYEVYVGGAGTGYRADPLKYTFVFPHQTVGSGSACKAQIQYYTPVGKVGTPVARNEAVDQIRVIIPDLRVRKTSDADGVFVGYANEGIYNAAKKTVVGAYERVNIEPDMWIARNDADGWTEYLPCTDEKDKLIAELKTEVKSLTDTRDKFKGALTSIHKTSGDVL